MCFLKTSRLFVMVSQSPPYPRMRLQCTNLQNRWAFLKQTIVISWRKWCSTRSVTLKSFVSSTSLSLRQGHRFCKNRVRLQTPRLLERLSKPNHACLASTWPPLDQTQNFCRAIIQCRDACNLMTQLKYTIILRIRSSTITTIATLTLKKRIWLALRPLTSQRCRRVLTQGSKRCYKTI